MENTLTPQEWEIRLGEHIKSLRLLKNIDRQTLCQRAGISVSALRHLESGQGAAIKTLVRALMALERQEWLGSIAPPVSINPLHMVRRARLRQRASRRTTKHD